MRLYRKVIPKIARDIVAQLCAQQLVEIEEGRKSEAELDLAAVMVEHMNAEEEVIREAKETLSRRGLGPERFSQVLRSIADVRHVKLGDESVEALLEQILEVLFASKNIAEIFGEDKEMRKLTKEIMDKYLAIPEELDKEARGRLKNIREGTPEWEIEYPRMVSQLKRQRKLAD